MIIVSELRGEGPNGAICRLVEAVKNGQSIEWMAAAPADGSAAIISISNLSDSRDRKSRKSENPVFLKTRKS